MKKKLEKRTLSLLAFDEVTVNEILTKKGNHRMVLANVEEFEVLSIATLCIPGCTVFPGIYVREYDGTVLYTKSFVAGNGEEYELLLKAFEVKVETDHRKDILNSFVEYVDKSVSKSMNVSYSHEGII